MKPCVIVDEFQNLTKQQLGMVLGRLGKKINYDSNSDPQQIDLKFPNDSPIHEVRKNKRITICLFSRFRR